MNELTYTQRLERDCLQIEKERDDFKEALKGSMLEHTEVIEKLISLNLWQAERLQNTQYKSSAYDQLETLTGENYNRI